MTEETKRKRERVTRPFPTDGLAELPEILDFMKIGRSNFYRLIEKGAVQKPVKLGRAARWPAKHIREVAGVLA